MVLQFHIRSLQLGILSINLLQRHLHSFILIWHSCQFICQIFALLLCLPWSHLQILAVFPICHQSLLQFFHSRSALLDLHLHFFHSCFVFFLIFGHFLQSLFEFSLLPLYFLLIKPIMFKFLFSRGQFSLHIWIFLLVVVLLLLKFAHNAEFRLFLELLAKFQFLFLSPHNHEIYPLIVLIFQLFHSLLTLIL